MYSCGVLRFEGNVVSGVLQDDNKCCCRYYYVFGCFLLACCGFLLLPNPLLPLETRTPGIKTREICCIVWQLDEVGPIMFRSNINNFVVTGWGVVGGGGGGDGELHKMHRMDLL